MKEIEAIVKMYDKIDFQQSQAALATVVRVEGSSYRRTGARMLIQDDGSWTGGIRGGCLEGDARRRAKKAIVQNKASIVTYDTTEDDAHQIGVGLGCNGIIDVLITPLKRGDENNPVELLRACTNDRKTNVLITITKINSSDSALQAGQMFLFESEEKWRNTFLAGTILNDQILKDINIALNQKKSAIRQYADPEVKEIQLFIEVLPPAVHLVLYGSNYDIYPMVNIGKELGWKVSVVANIRQINKSLYQQAYQVIAQKTAKASIDEHTALLLMAHDYKTDLNNLKAAIATNAPYIGLLGPRKRFDKMLKELEEEGNPLTEEDLQKIYNPVGLDIGATTPEEIALSIAAEVKSHFAGKEGRSLRLKDGQIHEK